MKKSFFTAVTVFAATILWLAGCTMSTSTFSSNTSPTSTGEKISNGTAGSITMEFNQMSMQSETVDTTNKWKYNSVSKWWIRDVKDSLSPKRIYSRIDSLQFTDSASKAKDTMPVWISSAGWTHIRHTLLYRLADTLNCCYAMNVAITKSTDTVATWNGTITGMCNDSALTNTTVTNVVRQLKNNGKFYWWSFPTSGTIDIANSLLTWNITYTGSEEATAVVTRKSDGKTKTITINLATGKETE